jgi:hypothetical protein
MATMNWFGRLVVAGALLATVSAALQAQETGAPFVTYDQELVRLAEKIPGFGGLWRDPKGRTHVYLTDLSRAPEVQQLDPEGVEVHRGDYDIRDLAAWKGGLRSLLRRAGAISLDLDEASNRLRLQVEKGSEAEMETALRSLRVPREAVILEVAEPVRPLELLTDRIRPVPAGVRIRNANGGGCTLGVNAVRSGVRGFVTNSHCSAVRGSVDGTVFYQRSNGVAADRVGVEIADPPHFTGGSCPSGKVCRYSDASFVDYDSNALSGGLTIANPLICGVGFAAPLTVNPSLPRLDITDWVFGSLPSGTLVTKVGATSGCTHGSIQATCTDSNVAGTNITMLCQDRVGDIALGGDSGSPVFVRSGDEATFLGVLWGGTSGSYVYSPWLFVHAELGGLLLIP